MWSKATLAAELQNSKVLHVPGQQLVPSCLQITMLRYDDDDDDDDDDEDDGDQGDGDDDDEDDDADLQVSRSDA
jgi:hypothetical protein